MDETESEFGKGLTYCIGLFLAHTERATKYKKEMAPLEKEHNLSMHWPEMWFNGASDHLCELDVSKIDDEALREEIISWKEKVLHWGHGFEEPKATEENIHWSIKKATEFLRQIDEKLLKTETIKGQWE